MPAHIVEGKDRLLKVHQRAESLFFGLLIRREKLLLLDYETQTW
tara:strand:- start:919 stop:1050 length:132 start_codon:yes stop_codon:yes gene_type:complete